MKMSFSILVVGIAALMLLNTKVVTNHITMQFHTSSFVDGMAKHQICALIIAFISVIAILIGNPESKELLDIGQLNNLAKKEKWLGIKGNSPWTWDGLQLLLFISLATGLFMFFGVKHSNSLSNFEWGFMPLVLLFSLTNALSEELIFRFGIVGGLLGDYPVLLIMIISAVIFGLPHYLGNPGGIIGVIMSGILGYVLCKATIETKGLFVAWTIHFVQDIIIFTALMMMMNVKSSPF